MILKKFEEYRELFDNIFDGAYFVDNDRKILAWNDAAEQITGFSKKDVEGSFCFNNILHHVDDTGKNLCKNGCPLLDTLITGNKTKSTLYLRHKSGYRVPVRIRIIPFFDTDKKTVIGAIEVFQEISNRNKLEEKLAKLAREVMTDPLTGIPNRKFADKNLLLSLNEAKALDETIGVVFIDIDNFKKYNDNYGHDIGDQTLKTVATSLVSNIRISDNIARWGGEEFIGIFNDINEKQLNVLANKLRILVENSSVPYKNEDLSVTISIGATIMKKTDTPNSIVERADKLMYVSKKNGRNQVTIG